MKTNNEWKNYKIIKTAGGMKLENVCGNIILRPDPQIIWGNSHELFDRKDLSAVYTRSASGGGEWKFYKSVPDNMVLIWRNLKFNCRLMGFKHIGVFPEQAVNWARMIDLITSAKRPIKVLNLFAYTGGATLACLSAGASVCHVDAAKAMCLTAGENVKLSELSDASVRFIVDDCIKFVEREVRRGNRYDAIIMDPPSYGRGPKGEMWKLEEKIYDLVKLTDDVLSDNPLFYLINSYTTGLQPTVMKNILELALTKKGKTDADEIGIPTEEGIDMPCGCSAWSIF